MTETHQASVPERDRLRGELVNTINHELRTPLTALLGHTELLQDLDLPESAQHSLVVIARAGDRLLDLARAVSQIIELDRVTPSCSA